jgi:phenylacetate-CoA ligase
MLHENEKSIIEEYFRAPICSRYGSREFGAIAHECNCRSGFHIVPARFVIETDANGELLITDLDNYATPFIRYAIGDVGTIQKIECSCGLILDTILGIEGRSNDYVLTPSGKRLGGQFWTTSSRAVGGIDEFQVVQKTIDAVEIRAKVSKDFKMTNLSILHDKIKKFSGDDLDINLVIVDELERTSMGKRRFIINLLNQQNAAK